uniref:EOG090X07NA n=1 Tax=Evadne anonyx TaxID=141404 RepID=A0A9N6WXS1_9CRUS|nr:EOG090X07NA [Evadne anonyx]
MEVDDDDPVVQEIPVFLAKNLLEKLYVFQYPLRSVSAKAEAPHVIAARIKPKIQDVELEIEIPTESRFYDRSKGEAISINSDGVNPHMNPDESNFFKSTTMDKIMYTSTQAQVEPGRYAVGLLSNQELHLNPIHGILHVKPAFQYLDKADKNKEKSEMKETDEPESDDDTPEQITVKFARTETDRSKAAREKSFGFLQKKNAEESWINTQFHHFKSEESQLERRQLLCSRPDNTINNVTLPKKDYLNSLVGPRPNPQLAPETLSMNQIRHLPLSDQVKHLLVNVKVISFSCLCSVLQVSRDTQQQLLIAVQSVALLIQGNWVVKSEILYPYSEDRSKFSGKSKLVGVTGICPKILTKARDRVLHEFTLNRVVDRDALTRATRIPTLDMKTILSHIAIFKPTIGWEFRLPFDDDFVSR